MRLSRPLSFLHLASLAGAIAYHRSAAEGLADVSKQFVVELTSGSDVDSIAHRFTSERGARVVKVFRSSVFTGLTIETDTDNINSLELDLDVTKVWHSSLMYLDQFSKDVTLQAMDDIKGGIYSTHGSTGVSRAHEEGIFGKGVKIAIVDTGIDYNHEALGGGFGEGFKVTTGYDYVGDGTWPYGNNPKEPDEDPMDYAGHGTHVAGIIAGKNDWFSGVAPEAELRAYKVFTEQGPTDVPTLIEAFLDAFEDGADIITASIGGASNWAENPWALVASRIAHAGVVVTISAGNSGEYGPFWGTSGASGRDVLSVASLEADTLVAKPFELSVEIDGKKESAMFTYIDNGVEWNYESTPIYPFSLNTTDVFQACDPLPDDTPDLTDVIVLVKLGGCEPVAKEFNLSRFNATRIMWYNVDNKRPSAATQIFSRAKSVVEKEVGEYIIDMIKAGGNVTADFTKYPKDESFRVGIHNAVGNRPSYYTSWGGMFDMTTKPDIAAPGGYILSTTPEGTWSVYSGTSMACPYVAGVAALYISKFGGREVHGKDFARKLHKKVISSGKAVPWNIADSLEQEDTGFLAPPIQVGGGLVDAWKLLSYTTELSFDKWDLNDTHHYSRYHSVDITNNADVEVEYSFSLEPAAGIYMRSPDNEGVAVKDDLFPIEMVPTVRWPAGRTRVLPGQTRTAELVITYPSNLNETEQPVFGGKVVISSSLDEELSIPYSGAAFNLKKEYDSIFFENTPLIRSPTLDIWEKSNFTFAEQDYPKVFSSFRFGCDELRWDIFESGWTERKWKYPPVVGQDGYVGSVAMWELSQSESYFNPETDDKEQTISFPLTGIFRSTVSYQGPSLQRFYWLGKLDNGTYIQPGKYMMRFAALRPFGNRESADNWDVWRTPEIEILPAPE